MVTNHAWEAATRPAPCMCITSTDLSQRPQMHVNVVDAEDALAHAGRASHPARHLTQQKTGDDEAQRYNTGSIAYCGRRPTDLDQGVHVDAFDLGVVELLSVVRAANEHKGKLPLNAAHGDGALRFGRPQLGRVGSIQRTGGGMGWSRVKKRSVRKCFL